MQQIAFGTVGQTFAPRSHADQGDNQHHRNPRRSDPENAGPTEFADDLVVCPGQRTHPDGGGQRGKKTGHSDEFQRPFASNPSWQSLSHALADVDHDMHPIGKSDQAQEHRQDHKAKGVLLKVKVPKEPQGPEDSDDRRCGDDQDDRQAAKQDRSHQQDHAIADGLITDLVVPVVFDQYQTQWDRAGDVKLHRHTRMLLGDLPSGSQNRLGALGVILDI